MRKLREKVWPSVCEARPLTLCDSLGSVLGVCGCPACVFLSQSWHFLSQELRGSQISASNGVPGVMPSWQRTRTQTHTQTHSRFAAIAAFLLSASKSRVFTLTLCTFTNRVMWSYLMSYVYGQYHADDPIHLRYDAICMVAIRYKSPH